MTSRDQTRTAVNVLGYSVTGSHKKTFNAQRPTPNAQLKGGEDQHRFCGQ
jgi:hypothetical protein